MNQLKQLPDEILEQAADWIDLLEDHSPDELNGLEEWLNQDEQHIDAMLYVQRHFGEHVALIDQVLRDNRQQSAFAGSARNNANAGSESDGSATVITLSIAKPASIHSEQTLEELTGLPEVNMAANQAEIQDTPTEMEGSTRNSGVSSYWYATAAMLLLTVGLFLLGPINQPTPEAMNYLTGIGEQKKVLLEDGTRLHVNADSHMSVTLMDNSRHVSLDKGEVFFEVAPDSKRPFEISHGDLSIRVLGTAFNVDLTKERTLVAVEHGRVAVRVAGTTTELTAGEAVRVINNEIETLRGLTQAHVAGWRQGWREAKNEPLHSVVAHLQRFSHKTIELKGVEKQLVFSGRYKQTDTEATLNLLCELFDLQLEIENNTLIIYGRDV